MVEIGNDWDEILKDDFEQTSYHMLRRFLINEYKEHTVYPEAGDIFNAFKATPYDKVRVVILGQDPYHEPGQAHGMAFSVNKGVRQPASLVNIFKELEEDTGISRPPADNGYLMPWAEQGVLLLNTVLTVREHDANSHKGKGWEELTDSVIRHLNEREKPLVFILWGRNAGAKESLIDNSKHLILKGAHPSPYSAYNGFFGGRYFSKTNHFLSDHGLGEVDWRI